MPILNIKIAPAKTVTVSDVYGNSLEVPSFGSISYNESQEWTAIALQARTEGWPDRKYFPEEVAMFLRSRLPEAEGKSTDELFDGVPLSLIEELYEFFYVNELHQGKDPRKKLTEAKEPPMEQMENPIGKDSTSEPDSITPMNGTLPTIILETAPLA